MSKPKRAKPRIRSKDDIRAFVREQARKRRGDHAFLFDRNRLIIGTSNEEGEWWIFDCHPGEPEWGHEPRRQSVRSA